MLQSESQIAWSDFNSSPCLIMLIEDEADFPHPPKSQRVWWKTYKGCADFPHPPKSLRVRWKKLIKPVKATKKYIRESLVVGSSIFNLS